MTKQRHLPGLDGLRGLAVLMVFVYHYGGGTHSSIRAMRLFGFFNKGGWVGVTLFFILSGFLITGILWDSFQDPSWWRKFYMRRALRIFPLYFGTLLLVLLAALAAGTFLPALRAIWVPLLFLQNIPSFTEYVNHLSSPLPLFHFWSLAVEEQFYLLWPFLLVAQKTRRRGKVLCAVTFVAAFLFRAAVWHFASSPPDFIESLPARAGELAAGGWLALSFRGDEWTRIVRAAPVCAVHGLGGFLAVGLYARSFETDTRSMMIWGLPCVTLCFASILVMSIEPGIVSRWVSAAFLRWFGGISFGLYVFHVLLGRGFHAVTMALVGGRGAMAQNAVGFAVAAVGSTAAAMLSWRFFEQPFLKLKSRYAAKPTQAVEERATADGSTV